MHLVAYVRLSVCVCSPVCNPGVPRSHWSARAVYVQCGLHVGCSVFWLGLLTLPRLRLWLRQLRLRTHVWFALRGTADALKFDLGRYR